MLAPPLQPYPLPAWLPAGTILWTRLWRPAARGSASKLSGERLDGGLSERDCTLRSLCILLACRRACVARTRAPLILQAACGRTPPSHLRARLKHQYTCAVCGGPRAPLQWHVPYDRQLDQCVPLQLRCSRDRHCRRGGHAVRNGALDCLWCAVHGTQLGSWLCSLIRAQCALCVCLRRRTHSDFSSVHSQDSTGWLLHVPDRASDIGARLTHLPLRPPPRACCSACLPR